MSRRSPAIQNGWRGVPTGLGAVVRLVTLTPPNGGDQVQKFRVVTWEVEPSDRKLVGYWDELHIANNQVLYDVPDPDSIVKGQAAFGMYKVAAGPRPQRVADTVSE